MFRSSLEHKRQRDLDAHSTSDGDPTSRRATQTLQYCIQKHDASQLHYDFRLELDGALKSWVLPKGPSLDPNVRRLAVHVEDHSLDYADFEGHIPDGHYGAGEVIVWDRGTWIPEGDAQHGYSTGKLLFRLQGQKLSGLWRLYRTRLGGKKEQWLLVKSVDAESRSETHYSIVAAEPASVLSERTIEPRRRQGED